MKIIINCFENAKNPEVKIQYEDCLKDLISKLSTNLELDLLEYIIVPENFGEELNKFQREHGLTEEYTNDENGTAFGKTLTYSNYDTIGNTIFLDKANILALGTEHTQFAIHLIHHELCHVHNDFMMHKMLGTKFMLTKRGSLDVILKIYATAIWAEYIATKLSVTTTNNGNNWNIKFLLDLVKIRKDNCDTALEMYKKTAASEVFYGQIQLNSYSVLSATCIVYGYLHGMEYLIEDSEMQKIKLTIKELLKETYFDEIWELLNKQLKSMVNSYPNWNGENEISKLGKIVLKMWNKMGMYPIEDSRGLRIDILN